MRIGVPKEIKDQENRVALTPEGARTLVSRGHAVNVEEAAGRGSGFSDDEYAGAGATICAAAEAWDADLVLKVKEPQASEYGFLRDQFLFTYFHLSGVTESLTAVLLDSGTTAVAYETVEDEAGHLPLLAPMSAVAGNMSVVIGSYYLAKFNGGRGMQLGTVLGQRHGKVLVVGDGVVGRHAARTADAMGASVYICSRHEEREAELAGAISPSLSFVLSRPENIARHVEDADLLVGAVLLRGAKATHLVSEEMVRSMQPGAVIVDVSIDQGGCVETSRPTSHSHPVYVEHGVTHYCVTNMPGAYPRTSTIALTSATLPYAVKLADAGLAALGEDAGFARGVNTCQGFVTYQPVAEDLGLMQRYKPFSSLSD
ncbi:MAG: alanine dehydrogenase [Gammaproteobacteria bacterium]|nr:alanine dehydrogenase [Gammaproteobacteria bacterium]NIN39582.1 alanine dehydrogenase [Gammaproteobacteria bacterium]NIO25139.1 alanine dehydrogenase [Gammaproteobacteria bacterium]NIO65768.1 alanine dehydrogenase [Gammaproteobacteria bacterium]NIP45795.1 alanine dehydrogenase [Gammaproteobacteria bacterium]